MTLAFVSSLLFSFVSVRQAFFLCLLHSEIGLKADIGKMEKRE